MQQQQKIQLSNVPLDSKATLEFIVLHNWDNALSCGGSRDCSFGRRTTSAGSVAMPGSLLLNAPAISKRFKFHQNSNDVFYNHTHFIAEMCAQGIVNTSQSINPTELLAFICV